MRRVNGIMYDIYFFNNGASKTSYVKRGYIDSG
jgi:hypothetical protein